jgi:hypothetical protein
MVTLMLFRPSFCANCGEKIERFEWGILTSRRFCQVCESEFKGHDLIPRVIVGFGILAGVFGFGSYLKSGPQGPGPQALRTAKAPTEQPGQMAQLPAAKTEAPVNAHTAANAAVNVQPRSADKNVPVAVNQASRQPTEVEGPVYYCGAATKKGTPCSRRVNGNTRCYQHTGMPAMNATARSGIKQR